VLDRSALALAAVLAVAAPAMAQWPYLVKDIQPGGFGSNPANFVSAGGIVFFTANDGTTGTELWRTDATSGGTVLVKDINPGSISSSPTSLTDVGGVLFFFASDGVNGSELWKSDGSAAGTVLVKDIQPGPGSSFSAQVAALGNLFFAGVTTTASGREPWISDGTPAGTFMLADICPGICDGSAWNPVVFGSNVFFGSNVNNSLWRTDGTIPGTVQVKSISGGTSNPSLLTVVGGTLFFVAFDSPTGFELWKSDGTAGGTALVKDISPGGSSSSLSDLTDVSGTLYFSASDGVLGSELWKSDGTAGGTVLVKDVRVGSTGSFPDELTAVKDRVYFVADDGVNGEELWESDGTDTGTFVRDVRVGSASSFCHDLRGVNDTLFFGGSGRLGDELHRVVRDTPGYRVVDDILRGGAGSGAGGDARIGPHLFISANDGATGNELWALRVDRLHNFTVTSRDGENQLEWMNPIDGNLQIRFRTDTFPADETDGTLLTTATGTGDGYESFSHSPIANETTFYYRAFVDDGSTVVSNRTAKGRPQSMSGPVQWIYNTGAVSTEPPGLAPVMVLSNDWTLHSIAPGASGGAWPPGWRPFQSKALAQGRPPVLPLTLGPASRFVLFSSNEGVVYAVDGSSGELLWRSADLGLLQAMPAAMFTAFGGDHEVLLVGTREPGGNAFYGLSPANGNISWDYDNIGIGTGPISSSATVDYDNNRVYFASRVDGGGSDRTVWGLGFTSSNRTFLWSRGLSDVPSVGEIDGSPTLRAGRVYVGTNDSRVHAFDAVNGADLWTAPFVLDDGGAGTDGQVKSFVWAPHDGTQLYLSTTNTVWALLDDRTAAVEIWRTTAIPKPSAPLRIGDFLYVGGDDGKLYEIDLTQGPTALKSIQLGDGSARVGAPSFDLPRFMIYAGTESGAVYGVRAPLP